MVSQNPPRRPPRPPTSQGYRQQQGQAQPPHGRVPPPRRPAPEPPRSHALRNTLIAAASLAAVVAGGFTMLSFLFPGETVRDYLVAEVKARTGRDLVVKGPATFSAVPSASVSLQDVTLSSPPGQGDAPPLVTMGSIDVSVALWPLLWREVVVESVVLKDPVIDLAVDAGGRNNWTIKRSARRPIDGRIRYAQAETGTMSDAERAPPSFEALRRHNISDIALHDMRIDNGTIRYRDARTDRSHEMTAITAEVAVKSLASPATAKGRLTFRGEPVQFAMELGAIEPLLSHASSRLALKLTSRPFAASYDGTVFPDNGEAEGSLSVTSSSLASAARWLGASLPDDAALGTLDLTGQLRTAGKVHTLSNANLTVNGTVTTGQLSLDTGPAKPLLRGDLDIGDLDLNRLLAPQRETPEKDEPAAPATGSPSSPTVNDGTRVNGYSARGGWNEDPIRLAGLAVLDADLKLAIGSLKHRDIEAGSSRISLALSDSVLKATIDEAALYDGTARGFIVLDGRTADVAHVGINLTFDNVTLRPFLQDAAKLDWIEGRGTVTIAVAGSGAHQRALIENLAGKADLKVGKGAVMGVDVSRMADNLANGRLTELKPQPGDKTTFSALTATWQIRNGVAHNGDLRLTSDVVQVTGSGTVSLPDRSLDYTVRPKLAGEGQQEGRGLAGIEVPVRVSGSWEKPSYKADAGGAVDELGRRLKGKNSDEIVDELVGKDSETGKKAKKLLDKLFR